MNDKKWIGYYRHLGILLLYILSFFLNAAPNNNTDEIINQRLTATVGEYTSLTDAEGDFNVRRVMQDETLKAFIFQSLDVVNIPAYSGKPLNMLITMNPEGVILDAYLLEHHEPILLIGIPEHKLHDFSAKYQGVMSNQRVVIGNSKDPNAITIDAVTGATVTVMVLNEVVMQSSYKVAQSLGLISAPRFTQRPATIKTDGYQPASWQELTGNGAIRRLHLTRADIDNAFMGTEAEDIERASPEQANDTFIDLYVTHLNSPTIGRNLLGDNQYRFLMEELKPGEHAIAVMANGLYSYKGSGYVRGGIFDRIQIRQNDEAFSFRDLDHQRLSDVYAAGMPDFSEISVFTIRQHHEFDPGTPWNLELLVRRQTGPVSGVFSSFELGYQLPEEYLTRPQPTAEELAAIEEANRPLWLNIWYQKSFQIGVLLTALLTLMAILFLQDVLTKKPNLLRWLRHGYLTFTVLFIGWYAMGQLSVVNVLTFLHALMQDFQWSLFLTDPMIFILWSFTAACILLWGRGVFCGWLCPFGALQELINEAARKLKIRQFELPFAVHERLWAIKYLILLFLFGLSLESLSLAEQFAEVEPFKTTFTLHFSRQWWFVLYVVLLLVINIFTRKVYCRYICPLGAALAIPTKLKLFDWLKRRKECGSPCRLCAIECEIQAIHPDGRIDPNECHHCLDCQVTYHNEKKCPPLIAKSKKRKAAADAARQQQIPVVEINS